MLILNAGLYKLPFFGKRILQYIVRKEGGEMESKTLRDYYLERYSTNIDLYTYGGCFSPSFNTGGI